MVQIAVADFFPADFPIKVHDIEVKNGLLIPTYFLMKKLEKEYSEHTFYFILGSDLIPTLYAWDEGLKLLEEINFIVFQREVFMLKTLYRIMRLTYTLSRNTPFPKSSSK